jgi:hypothetical protein
MDIERERRFVCLRPTTTERKVINYHHFVLEWEIIFFGGERKICFLWKLPAFSLDFGKRAVLTPKFTG